MENREPSVEQQVWQRVLGQSQPGRSDLRPLLLSAMEAAADYRYLTGVLTGSQRELAKRLWEGQQAVILALKGLLILSGSAPGKDKAMPVPREQAGKVLERSYHRSRKAMVEYTARSADSELGVVFQKLAHREAEHCALIAQLLGSTKK